MMIVTPRSWPLPVGQIYTPPITPVVRKAHRRRHHASGKLFDTRSHAARGGAGTRRIVLHHPEHGEWTGPFFVRREVTLDEYCAWYEQETGERVSSAERRCELLPSRHRFYEISID